MRPVENILCSTLLVLSRVILLKLGSNYLYLVTLRVVFMVFFVACVVLKN